MLFQKINSIKLSSIKSSDTPLRKSDRRKLLSQVLQQQVTYSDKNSNEANNNSNDDHDIQEILQDIIISNKNNSDILKRKLFINKVDKKQQFNKNAILYFRTPNTCASNKENNNSFWKYNRTIHPIFLEIDTNNNNNNNKLLVPCLSIVSIAPNILPIIYIHSGTSKYICRGANLMSVGIIAPEIIIQSNINKDYTLPKEKGILVSICAYGNPTPFSVGIWQGIDNHDNVAVTVLLGYGDDLWRMQCLKDGTSNDNNNVNDDGNYGNIGFINGTHILPIIQNGQDQTEEEVEEEEKDQVKEQSDINKNIKEEDQINNNDNATHNHNNDNIEDDDDDKIIEENNEKVIKLLYKSFLQITKQSIKLPIPISTFYSKYYKPTLQDENLDLNNNTTFKKISFLLMFLQNDYLFNDDDDTDDDDDEGCGFILSDDRNLLVDIDTSHSYYINAKKIYSSSIPKQQLTTNNKRKVAVASLYIIPNHIINHMELVSSSSLDNDYDVKANNAKNDKRRGTGFLTLPEIRDIIFKYCANHNLDDKKDIVLNDTLVYVLYQSNKTLKQKYNNNNYTIPKTISKKDILELWKNCLESAYAIVKLPLNEIISMKRGVSKPSKINIIVEKRNNKKYITTISGLYQYNIDNTLFSNDISKRFGCSCSISNDNKDSSISSVIIQGNVGIDVQYLLTCGMEGNSSHGNVIDYNNNNDKFILNYDDFFIPKGVCEIILRKGVKPKKK